MAAALLMIFFWLGFRRVEVKRPPEKIKVEFEPPKHGYSGTANIRYEKGWVKPPTK